MAGYTRQSIADIINGAEITAPPLNAEFNQLSAAFNATTGHSHDGTAGNSPKINLTTSVAGYLPAAHGGVGGLNNTTATTNPVVTDDSTQGYAPGSIWENTTTGRIFICVGNASGAAVWRELVQVQTSNVIFPEVNDTVDLGSVTNRFQDLFLSGGIAASGNTSLGGTLNVNGSTALSTTLAVTGLSTLATVDINGGNIDGTVIGASTRAAGNFTTTSTTGLATLASADINGGTIDGTVIGGSTATTVTGTNVTATTGFSGDLTGSVTGNVTGNLTGNVTGNVDGNVTGDVTSTGTSTFQNVTVNGSLNMNAGTAATVTGLSAPVNATDAATKLYVDTSVSNLVASAPGALDTLNELAAALGDDPNFATTVTTSISTKVSKAGDTMTGNLAMSNAKITGLGTPTAGTDATTKTYVDGQDATKLNLSGGTMTGGIVMGANKVTSTATPTVADDLTRKGYVDSILGSATSAADSAAAASSSATSAANSAAASLTSEQNADTSETNAANSAAAALVSEQNAASSAASINPNNIDINGGTIDGTVIGGSTAAAISGTTGQFGTSLNVDGTVTADGLTVDGNPLIQGAQPYISLTDSVWTTGATLRSGVNTLGTAIGDYFLINAPSGKGVSISTNNSNNLATFAAGGDISFYEDTGTTPKFFWDASAESLGLGTVSPDRKLTLSVSPSSATDDGVKVVEGSNNAVLARTGSAYSYKGVGASSTLLYSNNTLSFLADGSSNMTFHNGGNERMRIDSSGNLGLGVTPSAWSTLYSQKAFQFGPVGSLMSLQASTTNNQTYVNSNAVNLSSDWTYMYSDSATQYRQYAGTHVWSNAPSGTAGNAITFTQAMTLDASGNLLVGKTSASSTIAGVQAISDGRLFATVSNDHTLIGNRLSSDGAIATFQKDNTTVGSIGSTGGTGEVYIANNDSVGLKFTNVDAIVPSTHTGGGANRDAAIDLGYSSGGTNVRFKDLYLSGGVYLGGTVAANLLDDYEEGTWTPSVSTGAVSLTGTYIKVGKLVSIFLNGQVTTGGATSISGLPFNTAGNYGFSPYVSTQDIPSGQNSITFVTNGSTLLVRAIGDNTTYSDAPLTTGAYIHASFVFEAT